jgi:hypothetical protein
VVSKIAEEVYGLWLGAGSDSARLTIRVRGGPWIFFPLGPTARLSPRMPGMIQELGDILNNAYQMPDRRSYMGSSPLSGGGDASARAASFSRNDPVMSTATT